MIPTTRLGAKKPETSDGVSGLREAIGHNADLLATAAIDTQGTIGARPGAGNRGTLYFATDRGVLYRDNGAAWVALNQRRWVADISATSYTFTGLSGSVDLAYKLTFEGYWAAAGGGADGSLALRLPGATGANSLHRRCYKQGGTINQDVFDGIDGAHTGIVIAGRYFGGANMVAGEALIQAAAGPNSRVIRGSYVSRGDFVNDAEPIMMGDIAGYWLAGGTMTQLVLDFGGQNFAGRLVLEAI